MNRRQAPPARVTYQDRFIRPVADQNASMFGNVALDEFYGMYNNRANDIDGERAIHGTKRGISIYPPIGASDIKDKIDVPVIQEYNKMQAGDVDNVATLTFSNISCPTGVLRRAWIVIEVPAQTEDVMPICAESFIQSIKIGFGNETAIFDITGEENFLIMERLNTGSVAKGRLDDCGFSGVTTALNWPKKAQLIGNPYRRHNNILYANILLPFYTNSVFGQIFMSNTFLTVNNPSPVFALELRMQPLKYAFVGVPTTNYANIVRPYVSFQLEYIPKSETWMRQLMAEEIKPVLEGGAPLESSIAFWHEKVPYTIAASSQDQEFGVNFTNTRGKAVAMMIYVTDNAEASPTGRKNPFCRFLRVKTMRLVLTGEDINFPSEPKYLQLRDLISRTLGEEIELVENENAYWISLGSDPSTVNYTGGLNLRDENAQLLLTMNNATTAPLTGLIHVISFFNAVWGTGDFFASDSRKFSYYRV
jgi:hypothetical protein